MLQDRINALSTHKNRLLVLSRYNEKKIRMKIMMKTMNFTVKNQLRVVEETIKRLRLQQEFYSGYIAMFLKIDRPFQFNVNGISIATNYYKNMSCVTKRNNPLKTKLQATKAQYNYLKNQSNWSLSTNGNVDSQSDSPLGAPSLNARVSLQLNYQFKTKAQKLAKESAYKQYLYERRQLELFEKTFQNGVNQMKGEALSILRTIGASSSMRKEYLANFKSTRKAYYSGLVNFQFYLKFLNEINRLDLEEIRAKDKIFALTINYLSNCEV
jgi:hypothetical protein